TRLDDIRSNYGRELIDLCGVPVSGNQEAATVVDRFLNVNDPNGHLTPQDCYVQTENLDCAGSEHTPLGSVNPSCLRGQVGEAWLAAQSAAVRVVRATLARKAAHDTEASWWGHCTNKQGIESLDNFILGQLKDLEAKESKLGDLFGAIKGVGE